MDIVLASEDTWFQDLSHFPRGMVPGDGQHVVWEALVGPSRARYLLLMGYKLTAQEAREWGVVHEVLPKDKLLDRAWEIAARLAMRPPIATRNTRHLLVPESQAGLPQRARSRPPGRDVGPAPVLPFRCRNAGPGPAVGPEAVVRLTMAMTSATRCHIVKWPAWEDAAFYLQEPAQMYASIACSAACMRRCTGTSRRATRQGSGCCPSGSTSASSGSHPELFSSQYGFAIGDASDPSTVIHQLPEWAQQKIREGNLSPAETRRTIAHGKLSMGDPNFESLMISDPPAMGRSAMSS